MLLFIRMNATSCYILNLKKNIHYNVYECDQILHWNYFSKDEDGRR